MNNGSTLKAIYGIHKRAICAVVLVLFFIFWIYIASAVPYTHDDWDWGLDVGLEQWLTCSVNNRVVGNFFVVIMTRSVFIKTAVMGCGMFLLSLLIALAIDREAPFLARFLCANTLIFSLPLALWRQTCGWVSGFANYAISCIMLLAGFLITTRIEESKKSVSPFLAIPLFFYALISCLIVENISVLILLLCIYWAVRRFLARSNRVIAVAYLLGAAVGCFLMFYNPMYNDLSTSGIALSGIRRLSFALDDTIAQKFASIITKFTVTFLPQPFLLSSAFCIMMGFLPLLCLIRSKRKCLYPVVPLSVTCGILLCFREDLPEWCVILCIIFSWISAIFSAAFSGIGSHRRVGFLVAAIGSIAPLALTTAYGERLFLVAFLFVGIAFFDAAISLIDTKALLISSCVFLCLQMGWYIHVYGEVTKASAMREQLAQEAIANNENTLIIPTERYKVWWGRNPQSDWRADYYRMFYNLPEDITLIFLPAGSFDVWPEISDEDWEQRFEYPPYKLKK